MCLCLHNKVYLFFIYIVKSLFLPPPYRIVCLFLLQFTYLHKYSVLAAGSRIYYSVCVYRGMRLTGYGKINVRKKKTILWKEENESVKSCCFHIHIIIVHFDFTAKKIFFITRKCLCILWLCVCVCIICSHFIFIDWMDYLVIYLAG